ncbi:MAG: RelA/SpoT domain-containing protein [Bacteroides sp.]|nr:RelA/SpoT domain-containing protein [Bacteroides sp.]
MNINTDEKKKPRGSELLIKFVGEFKRDEKEYKAVCAAARRRIKAALDTEGIMAIVTARVKDPDRLLQKLKNREKEHNRRYASREEIFSDIHDLVGARIALYFPSDAAKLRALLERDFELQQEPKLFPGKVALPADDAVRFTASKRKIYPGYAGRRFDGYCATHYRVKLRRVGEMTIPNPLIEIQVASVLMHAWSEVEHDLAYKNMMGQVSMEEYEALDEINGLVIAGEVALNRLDRLSQERLRKEGGKLASHYALATYLEDWLEDRRDKWIKAAGKADKTRTEEALRQAAEEQKLFALGDVKALFLMYTNGGKKTWDTKKIVKNDLKELEFDPAVPLAHQLEAMHEEMKRAMELPKPPAPPKKAQEPFRVAEPALLGEYLCDWINLQRQLKNTLRLHGFRGYSDSEVYSFVGENFDLSEGLRRSYRTLYLERNKVIHGNFTPTSAYLRRQREDMAEFLRMMEEELG